MSRVVVVVDSCDQERPIGGGSDVGGSCGQGWPVGGSRGFDGSREKGGGKR